jgi:hypothetical protein
LKIIASPRISTIRIDRAHLLRDSQDQRKLSGNVVLCAIKIWIAANFTHLGMDNDANELAVANHFLEVVLNCLLAQIVGPFLAGLGESLLLARIPVDRNGKHFCKSKRRTETDLLDNRCALMPSGDYCFSPWLPEASLMLWLT